MHFLRNALDHLPRRANDDCLQELRWIYDRRELAEVRRDLSAWLTKWSGKYGRLCSWVERLNQEIKRRTHMVRIFPNTTSCSRLVRALAVETHEEWLATSRYLNMEHLREHKQQQMRAAA